MFCRLVNSGLAGIFVFFAVISKGGSCYAGPPSFQSVKDHIIRSESHLFDRMGRLIHERRVNHRIRQMGWVALNEVSQVFVDAVIASEDRRFFRHRGVDWVALASAAGQSLLGRSSRGASTISMQVAAAVDSSLKPKKNFRRLLKQKFSQVSAATELERSWSKSQILEAYFNLISFRGELQGIRSAALGLFAKEPSGINLQESLVLAALIRSPNAPIQVVATRACALGRMLDSRFACLDLEKWIQARGLTPRAFPSTVALAPHVARTEDFHSTLDADIQKKVMDILRRQVLSFRKQNMNDAAALVVDNKTGQVLAYVGSVGDLSSAPAVDGVRALRQAGSTLKPFIYGLALEKKYLTASSFVDDSATNISLGVGSVYRPQDFDREYHGLDVTVRSALASSLNIPAVKTLQMVGVGTLIQRMRELGFTRLRSAEFYGPSLALGTADVSLWELVNAYRTLANLGLKGQLTIDAQEPVLPALDRVLQADAAFIISDILSDKVARSLTFGLDTPLALHFWAAAKTGTSKDMRDNWCIGYSNRYTVGVWAGNFSGESMWNVTGLSGAAPAWAEIMQSLPEAHLAGLQRPPVGVSRVQGEWYIQGTEPSLDLGAVQRSQSGSGKEIEKITYPVQGLVIARDPDIPPQNQKIHFEKSVPKSTTQWQLNGKILTDRGTYAWTPERAGQYELKLITSSGEVVDQVSFSVRN